jgi:hypothetical protein
MFRNLPVRGLEDGIRRIGFGSRVTTDRKGTHEVDNVRIFPFNIDADEDRDYVLNSCECGSIDFNNDGLFPDDSDLVDLLNHHEQVERIAEKFIVLPFDIPEQCCATYFPEANVLVPINSFADRSQTPTSKSVIITLRKHKA